MAQELLGGTQVSAGVQHMRGKGMAQGVRMHMESLSQSVDMSVNNSGDTTGGQPAAACIQEDRLSFRRPANSPIFRTEFVPCF